MALFSRKIKGGNNPQGGKSVHEKNFFKKIKKIFAMKIRLYICSPFGRERAISSVGLEHLPYKQGVVGSNPTSPTESETTTEVVVFF